MLPDGYPPLSVYEHIVGDSTYADMKGFSDGFRRNNATALEYYSNKWVADPLHNWSRRWEYLFVYERLKEMMNRRNCDSLNVLDAGSGINFFPHFILTRYANISIQCCDHDSQLEIDARKLVAPAVQAVSYSVQDISALTYPDAFFDAVYCISVLEHCDRYDEILVGFARILKPGGCLILTIDISLDGRSEIPREQAARLIDHLAQRFASGSDYAGMLDNCDESQILTTAYARKVDQKLLPWRPPSWHQSLRHLVRHGRLLKAPFSYLTCFCMSWTLPEAVEVTIEGG